MVEGKCACEGWAPRITVPSRRAACTSCWRRPLAGACYRHAAATTAAAPQHTVRLPRALFPLFRRTLHEGGVLVDQPQPISIDHHGGVAPPHPAHHLQHSTGGAGKGAHACTFSCAACITCTAHASFTCAACHSLPRCGTIPKLPPPAPTTATGTGGTPPQAKLLRHGRQARQATGDPHPSPPGWPLPTSATVARMRSSLPSPGPTTTTSNLSSQASTASTARCWERCFSASPTWRALAAGAAGAGGTRGSGAARVVASKGSLSNPQQLRFHVWGRCK